MEAWSLRRLSDLRLGGAGRALNVLGGVALVAVAVSRKSLLAQAAFGLVGGGLLYTGATGRVPSLLTGGAASLGFDRGSPRRDSLGEDEALGLADDTLDDGVDASADDGLDDLEVDDDLRAAATLDDDVLDDDVLDDAGSDVVADPPRNKRGARRNPNSRKVDGLTRKGARLQSLGTTAAIDQPTLLDSQETIDPSDRLDTSDPLDNAMRLGADFNDTDDEPPANAPLDFSEDADETDRLGTIRRG